MSSVEALKFAADVQSSGNCATCKLVAVSRCAQFITGDEDDLIPWASTAWGLGRTARLEFQNIRTMSVDLGKADSFEMHLLAEEMTVLFLNVQCFLSFLRK